VSPQAVEVDGSGQALTDAGLAFEALQLAPRLTVTSTSVFLLTSCPKHRERLWLVSKKPNRWCSCLDIWESVGGCARFC